MIQFNILAEDYIFLKVHVIVEKLLEMFKCIKTIQNQPKP